MIDVNKPIKVWGVVCFNPKTGYHFVMFDIRKSDTWALYTTRKEARQARRSIVERLGHKNFRVTQFKEQNHDIRSNESSRPDKRKNQTA